MERFNKPVISIAGEKVALGPLRRDLVELYDRWLNDPEVAIPYFLGDLRPDTAEETQERYDRMRREGAAFTIYEAGTWRPIGFCELSDVNYSNRAARFGILIGEKEVWGHGYGTEATALTLDWAYNAMGLHTVLLTVFSYNQRGLGAYRRAGFKEVGRWREAKRLGGKPYDIIYMDCLATEFRPPSGASALGRWLPGGPAQQVEQA